MTTDASRSAIDFADPLIVPNSEHHVGLSIRGELKLYMSDGETVDCVDVKGMSAVRSAESIITTEDGRPEIQVTRLMTHFHSNDSGLLIQQNPTRPNLGRLVGLRPGGVEALLPADVTFDQYLLVTFRGRTYMNTDPLVMAARGITEFPPIGTTFESQTATLFYDITEVPDGLASRDPGSAVAAMALASQTVCGSHLTHYIDMR